MGRPSGVVRNLAGVSPDTQGGVLLTWNRDRGGGVENGDGDHQLLP